MVVWIPVEHYQKLKKSKPTWPPFSLRLYHAEQSVFCCLKDVARHSASVCTNMVKKINTNLSHFHIKIKFTWEETHCKNQPAWWGRERKESYRFLCSRVRCQWELDWSLPCWRGTSCGLTWCCCGPIIWPHALVTWCHLSLCLHLSPHWLSSRGVAAPGQSCMWLRGMGGPLQSQGFEGRSLLL